MTTKVPVELSSTPSIVDGGNATAITIDSSEQIGIGTLSPSSELHVKSSGTSSDTLTIENSTGNGSWRVKEGGGSNALFQGYNASNTETIRLDPTSDTFFNNGNVGIGTTSPAGILHANSSGHTKTYITGGTSNDAQINFGDSDDNDIGGIHYDNAQNSMKFLTNTAERMRIDSSGKVGIGESAPANAKLEILQAGDHDAHSTHGIAIHSTGNTNFTSMYMGCEDGIDSAYIQSVALDGSFTSKSLLLNANGGSVCVGTTSAISSAKQTIYEASANYGLFIRKGDGTTGTSNKYIGFDISGGGATGGSITNASSGNAQFTATSDKRLKENIEDVTGCLDKVMALKPSSYTLKENKLDVPYGFIAQNVETVLPEFVSEDENGYKQISDGLTSAYIAVLTKAIQEQQEQIDALQSEINTLKGE